MMESVAHEQAGQVANGSEVILGLIAAPGTPTAVAAALAEQIPELLAEHLSGTTWRVEVVTNPLVAPPADDDDLVEAARSLLLDQGWDLALCLTDLPLTVRRRPVLAHASPLHGVGLVSVPALGPVGTHRQARETALRLLRTLLGDPDRGDRLADDAERRRSSHRLTRIHGRLRRLGDDRDSPGGAGSIRFTRRVLGGNLQLLLGMIWTNEPWRLAIGLSRALVAAVAVDVLALITLDVWRLADPFGGLRLVVLGLGAVAVTTMTLIIGAGLWEHALSRRARQQVVLFNVATTGTVLIGVLSLYAALFVLGLAAAKFLIVPSVLARSLGHQVGWPDYTEIAWFASSLAMIGGALGAGLESDEAVRQAAYTHRPSAPGPADAPNG